MMSDNRQRAAVRTGCAGISVRRQGSEKGAIGRRRIFDGRVFLPVPVTTFALHGCVLCRGCGTRAMERSKRGDAMRRQLTAVGSFSFVATSGGVLAHHSVRMFH